MPGTCAPVLKDAIAAPLVAIAKAILYNRIGSATIQVKTAAVCPAFRGFIFVRKTMLDSNAVCFVTPNADRAVAYAWHVPAVVRGGAIINNHICTMAHYNTIAAMVIKFSRVAGVIFGPAVRNPD